MNATTLEAQLTATDRAILAIAFCASQAAPHAEQLAQRRATERIARHVRAAAECAARQVSVRAADVAAAHRVAA
jgi:hypothetical protein